jgi:diguanylate cyclase (GGDEF)-like protein
MLGAVLSGISRRVRGHIGTDTLTGALNRSGLSAAADRALLVSRRQADEIAVAALDLDDFKQVNDRDGHLAGDRLLADAVAAWRGELRSDDVLARTGGDEFVLVMPGTSVDQAGALIERLRRAHAIEFSAGVARWDRDESFEACLERADRGLYADKARRQRPPLRLPRPPP